MPQNVRIWAKYLPVQTTDLPEEGVVIVAKTAYGPNGHVTALVNRGGTLYVVADSALIEGIVVPLSRYLGQV